MTTTKATLDALCEVSVTHPTNACAHVVAGLNEIATCYGNGEGAQDEDGVWSAQPIRDANAALIAEAFNVTRETGLTPRQLAEQRDELLAALKQALDYWSDRHSRYNPVWVRAAMAAIAKPT